MIRAIDFTWIDRTFAALDSVDDMLASVLFSILRDRTSAGFDDVRVRGAALDASRLADEWTDAVIRLVRDNPIGRLTSERPYVVDDSWIDVIEPDELLEIVCPAPPSAIAAKWRREERGARRRSWERELDRAIAPREANSDDGVCHDESTYHATN